jgi:hypothetical protein
MWGEFGENDSRIGQFLDGIWKSEGYGSNTQL